MYQGSHSANRACTSSKHFSSRRRPEGEKTRKTAMSDNSKKRFWYKFHFADLSSETVDMGNTEKRRRGKDDEGDEDDDGDGDA